MQRRTFLKIGGGILGSSILPAFADSQQKNKSVIFLWLGGGASHIETFDPKPDAPIEIRSTTGFISNKGIELGGSFNNLIKHADKLNIVRSFSHTNNNHSTATHWVMTGTNLLDNNPNAAQKEPSYGSIVSNLSSKNYDGMPNYVRVNKIEYDNAAWLGVQFAPYDARGEGVDNLRLKVGNDRFTDRRSLLTNLEKDRGSWSTIQNEAYNVLTGRAAEAFDLTKENEAIRNKYKGDLGTNLLLAKRLVERGTKFVTIHHGGWDMHSDIKKGFDSRATDLDYNLSTLVSDLYDEGVNKDVMIIVTGEFGRTYRINATAGRDHFSRISPLLFIGGDYQTGRIIGESSKDAAEPITQPFTPNDVTKTIFNHFGFDERVQRIDTAGRPRYFVNEGSKIIL